MMDLQLNMDLMQAFNIKKNAFGEMCINPTSLLLCYKLDENPVILKDDYDILGQSFTKLMSKHGRHVKSFQKYKFKK
jgi:hypothetical protein